jgi:hypothetical protein
VREKGVVPNKVQSGEETEMRKLRRQLNIYKMIESEMIAKKRSEICHLQRPQHRSSWIVRPKKFQIKNHLLKLFRSLIGAKLVHRTNPSHVQKEFQISPLREPAYHATVILRSSAGTAVTFNTIHQCFDK